MNFTHIRRLLLGFVFIMATIAFAKYGPFEYLLMIPAAGVMYLAGFSLEMAWKGAHTTEGVECWCEPEVEYIDPSDPESPVIVIHRDRSEAH